MTPNESVSATTTKPTRWPARLVALLVALVGVGFCFHTSFDPAIFGKYNLRYFVALCCWFLIFTPCAYLLARYVFSPTELRLPGRGRMVITPLTKFVTVLVMMFVLAAVGRAALRRIREHVGLWTFHPYLQNAYRPSRADFGINGWGFRGEEIDLEKPNDTFRVFMFGGSTVACQESAFEDTHCRLLEKHLRRQYPKVRIEVQNVGMPWHGTEHSVIKLLFNVQDFSPDLVIIYHAMADLFRGFEQPEFSKGRYRDDYGHYYGPVAGLIKGRQSDHYGFPRSTFLGFWLSDFRFERVRLLGPEGKGISGIHMLFVPKHEPVTIQHWRSLDAFERNMQTFVDNALSRGFEVLIASQPYLYRDDLTQLEREVLLLGMACLEDGRQPDVASMKRGMIAYNERARKVAFERQVRFLDLEKQVPKSLDHFFDDVHYTTQGNVAVAKAFAADIIHWGIIPQKMQSE